MCKLRDRSLKKLIPIYTYTTCNTIHCNIKGTWYAADVSQMIEKRMGSVGYKVMDVRISSDLLTHEGKERKVPTIEIDLQKINSVIRYTIYAIKFMVHMIKNYVMSVSAKINCV